MRSAAIVLVTLGLACAGAAAATERVSDLDYLKANRCKGLATALGGDTAGLDAMLKVQARTRNDAVTLRAEEEMTKAKREAARTDSKERLAAELNGPCLAYMAAGKDAAIGR